MPLTFTNALLLDRHEKKDKRRVVLWLYNWTELSIFHDCFFIFSAEL